MKSDKKFKKILVIDDEKPMAQALELKLNKVGYQVKAVFNGEEAIEALKSEDFDLIIVDLIMPKVDGFEILEYLKSKKDKTPVIVSSNLGQEEDLNRAKTFGVKDYFIKSDTPIIKVVEHVNKLFNK